MKVYREDKYCVPVKSWASLCDDNTLEQLTNISRLPFIHKHVAAMPDCHLGKGSTVGSVIPTKDAIIPAAVGVDIGCGMVAVKTNLTANQLPDNLHGIRSDIEEAVPVGFAQHEEVPDDLWKSTRERLDKSSAIGAILEKHPGIARNKEADKAYERIWKQVGTLGSGNHFIEVCLDEADSVWVMLHSGSRGIGNNIGSYFITKAKELMQQYFIDLPDDELAYLPKGSELFDDYWEALCWAQQYASENRRVMMSNTLKAIKRSIPVLEVEEEKAINCHHNYAVLENHFGQNVYVTRKGAVRAREGDLGIIPGSMGARSYIVRGKGNRESFESSPHGAGRMMSRAEARRRFQVADLEQQTEGIECRKDEDIIDEIPSAYKDIDIVMKDSEDLVEVVHTLRQVINIKG